MEVKLVTGGFNFLADKNIIYCTVYNEFTEMYHKDDIENMFSNEIFKLSKDVHIPILFNLEALSFLDSIKVFKYLSQNKIISSIVLSKSFLVKSYTLKVFLNFLSFICNPAIPDLIFKNYKLAINYCEKDNRAYNSIK